MKTHNPLNGGCFRHGLAAVWLVACLGCGSGLVPVEGKVTFDGQPVEDGSIVFEPVDGTGPSAGGPISAGRYVLRGDKGCTPGKKRVRITAVRKTGRMLATGGSDAVEETVEQIERYIPEIYNTNTTLTCEITAGEANEHDFSLEPR